MNEDFWTEENITKYVQNWKNYRQEVLRYIFSKSGWREEALKYVAKKSGTEEEGEEIFQNTLIALDQLLSKGKYSHENNLRGYFFGVLKYQHLNFLKEKGKLSPLEESQENSLTGNSQIYDADYPYISKEREDIVYQTLERLGATCRQILMLWIQKYSMTEIAKIVNLPGPDQAKRKRYKCWKSLESLLLDNPNLAAKLKLYYES